MTKYNIQAQRKFRRNGQLNRFEDSILFYQLTEGYVRLIDQNSSIRTSTKETLGSRTPFYKSENNC